MSQVNWSDIKNEFTESILLGNGASIAFSDNFKYNSLFEHAKIKNYLLPEVIEIFGEFDKTDFANTMAIHGCQQIPDQAIPKSNRTSLPRNKAGANKFRQKHTSRI